MKQFTLATFQIGKNGLTPGVLESIKLDIKNHKQVRISVLKSATRDRSELTKIADKIKQSMSVKCKYKLLGYTIILIKQ